MEDHGRSLVLVGGSKWATDDTSLGHPGFQPFRFGAGAGDMGNQGEGGKRHGDMGDSVQPVSTLFTLRFPNGFPLHVEMGRHCLGVGGRFCFRHSVDRRNDGAVSATRTLLPTSAIATTTHTCKRKDQNQPSTISFSIFSTACFCIETL